MNLEHILLCAIALGVWVVAATLVYGVFFIGLDEDQE